jgi:hypothetical protein
MVMIWSAAIEILDSDIDIIMNSNTENVRLINILTTLTELIIIYYPVLPAP